MPYTLTALCRGPTDPHHLSRDQHSRGDVRQAISQLAPEHSRRRSPLRRQSFAQGEGALKVPLRFVRRHSPSRRPFTERSSPVLARGRLFRGPAHP